MNVGRPPRVVVVAPRIWSRPDRRELVAPVRIGQDTPGAVEVRVKRRRPAVPPVGDSGPAAFACQISTSVSRNGLPSVSYTCPETMIRSPIGSPPCLHRQIVVGVPQMQCAIQLRARDLRDRVRQVHERLLRMTQLRRLVRRVVQRRVRLRRIAPITSRAYPPPDRRSCEPHPDPVPAFHHFRCSSRDQLPECCEFLDARRL